MPWRETSQELERARAEQPLVIPGPDGRLHGIFTPPAPNVPAAELCVLLLSRPRFEYHRITVEAARRLAAAGFACFRFDYHGWGESDGEVPTLDLDQPYRGDAVAVLRYLRAQMGQQRFVLWGSCFDARTAISVFMDEAAALEALVFISAPITRVQASSVYNWRNVARWATDREQWRQLLFSRRSRQRAVRALRLVFSRSLGRAVPGGQIAQLSPAFADHFDAFLRSDARAFFFYGTEDEEYQSFQTGKPTLLAGLDTAAQQRLEIEIWPGHVHTVLDVKRQREVLNRWLAWIEALHPTRRRQGAAA